MIPTILIILIILIFLTVPISNQSTWCLQFPLPQKPPSPLPSPSIWTKKDIANTSCLICKKKQSINHAKPPKAGKENDASGEDAERERRGKGDDQVQPAVINCQERWLDGTRRHHHHHHHLQHHHHEHHHEHHHHQDNLHSPSARGAGTIWSESVGKVTFSSRFSWSRCWWWWWWWWWCWLWWWWWW